MSSHVASVHNVSRGVDLGTEVRIADRWLSRARGYLGRPEPHRHQGMLLTPCRSIHMIGVRFALDIVFLDRDLRVLAVHHRVRPGFRTRSHTGATSVLELRAGRIAETCTTVGDVLEIRVVDRSENADPIAAGFKGESI